MTLHKVLTQFADQLPKELKALRVQNLAESKLKGELIPWLRDFSRKPDSNLEAFSRHIALALALAEGDVQEAVKLRYPGLHITIQGELAVEAFLAGDYLATKHEIDYVIYAAPAHVKGESAKKAFVNALKENYPAQTLAQMEALLTLEAIYKNSSLKSKAVREQFVQVRGKRLSVLSLEPLQGKYTGLFWKLFGSVPAYPHVKTKQALNVAPIKGIGEAWESTKAALSTPIFSSENVLEAYKQAKLDAVIKAFIKATEEELLPYLGTGQEAEKIKAFLAKRPHTRTAFGYTAMPEHPMNQFCTRLAASVIPEATNNPRETFWKLLYPEIQETVYAEDDSQWPDYGEALLVEENLKQLLNYSLITKMMQADNGAQLLKGEVSQSGEDSIQDELVKTRVNKTKLSTQSITRLHGFNRSSASKVVWQKMERPPLSARFKNFLEYFESLQKMLERFNAYTGEGGELDIGKQGHLAMHEYLMVMRTPEYDSVIKRLDEQRKLAGSDEKELYDRLIDLKYLFTEIKQRNDSRICFEENVELVPKALQIQAIREILEGGDLSRFTRWENEEDGVGHDQLACPEIENIVIEIDFKNANSKKIGEITTCLEQADDNLIKMVAQQYKTHIENEFEVLGKLHGFTYQIRNDVKREKFLMAYFSELEKLPESFLCNNEIPYQDTSLNKYKTALEVHAMSPGLRFSVGREKVSLGMAVTKHMLKGLEEIIETDYYPPQEDYGKIIRKLIGYSSILNEFLKESVQLGYELGVTGIRKLLDDVTSTPEDRKFLTEALLRSKIGCIRNEGHYTVKDAQMYLQLCKGDSAAELLHFLARFRPGKNNKEKEEVMLAQFYKKIDACDCTLDEVLDLWMRCKYVGITGGFKFLDPEMKEAVLAYMPKRTGKSIKNLNDYLTAISKCWADNLASDLICIEDEKVITNIKAELLERKNLHELKGNILLELAGGIFPESPNKYSGENDLDEKDIFIINKIISSLRIHRYSSSLENLESLFRCYNAAQKKEALTVFFNNNPGLTKSVVNEHSTELGTYEYYKRIFIKIPSDPSRNRALRGNKNIFESILLAGLEKDNILFSTFGRFKALYSTVGNTLDSKNDIDILDNFFKVTQKYLVNAVKTKEHLSSLPKLFPPYILSSNMVVFLRELKLKSPALFQDPDNFQVIRALLESADGKIEFLSELDTEGMGNAWLNYLKDASPVDLDEYYAAVQAAAKDLEEDAKSVLKASVEKVKSFSFQENDSPALAKLINLSDESCFDRFVEIARIYFSTYIPYKLGTLDAFIKELDNDKKILFLRGRSLALPSYESYQNHMAEFSSRDYLSQAIFEYEYKNQVKRFEEIVKLYIKHSPYANRLTLFVENEYTLLLRFFAEYDAPDKGSKKFTDEYYKALFSLGIFKNFGERSGDGLVFHAWACASIFDETKRNKEVCCGCSHFKDSLGRERPTATNAKALLKSGPYSLQAEADDKIAMVNKLK